MIYKCKVCNSSLEDLNHMPEFKYYGCRNKNNWHRYWFTDFNDGSGSTETYSITDSETRVYYELSVDHRRNESYLTIYEKRTHTPVSIRISAIIEVPETEEAIIKKLKKISMLA